MIRTMSILVVAVGLVLLTFGSVAGGAAQKIAITIRDFSYTPDKITVQAGVPVEIALVNKGRVKHEFMVYARPKPGLSGTDLREWADDNSYFKGLQVDVTGQGVDVERKGTTLLEIQIGTGKTATINFTPTKKGTFEFGCMIKDHYEAGQKGTLIVQ